MSALAEPEETRRAHRALRSRQILIAALASVALAVALMLPVIHAGFHPEDSGWLALARLQHSPWPLLTQNIDFLYFYRPVPLLLWWLSAHLFGASALWHNATDLLLHATNAALICVLAARLSGERLPGLIAGLVFAALPAGAGTAAWMSDRFDPVALLFSLSALIAFDAALAGRRSPWWAGAWLLLALLSKEVAYASAVLLLAWIALRAWTRREWPLRLGAPIVLACIAALALRVLTATTTAVLDIADPLGTFVAGVGGWWRRAPDALSGFQSPSLAWPLLAGAILALAAVASVRGGKRAWALAGCGAVLLAAPSLLQWPITALTLTHDDFAFTENLRFYYLASAGFALLAGAACASARAWRVSAVAACAILALCGLTQTHRLIQRWAHTWRPESKAAQRLGDELSTRDFPPGCRIALETRDWPAFAPHADTIVKAVAAPDAPVQACVVFAGTQTYQNYIPAAVCDAAHWPGLPLARTPGLMSLQTLGNVCIARFAVWKPEQLGTPLFRFRVDSDGHAQEIRD